MSIMGARRGQVHKETQGKVKGEKETVAAQVNPSPVDVINVRFFPH